MPKERDLREFFTAEDFAIGSVASNHIGGRHIISVRDACALSNAILREWLAAQPEVFARDDIWMNTLAPGFHTHSARLVDIKPISKTEGGKE